MFGLVASQPKATNPRAVIGKMQNYSAISKEKQFVSNVEIIQVIWVEGNSRKKSEQK